MTKLSQTDLDSFKEAISKDYGIQLEAKEIYNAAFNLLQFLETLIKFSEKDKSEGSKVVLDNPLNTSNGNGKME